MILPTEVSVPVIVESFLFEGAVENTSPEVRERYLRLLRKANLIDFIGDALG